MMNELAGLFVLFMIIIIGSPILLISAGLIISHILEYKEIDDEFEMNQRR